jgi:hypothetical protein
MKNYSVQVRNWLSGEVLGYFLKAEVQAPMIAFLCFKNDLS